MANGSSSSSWGPSPAAVTALVALLGLGVAAYIVGPPLYWHVAEALGHSAGACPACDALPLLQLPEDCAKQFKKVSSRASGEEAERSFTELLIEELKQREEEATEAQQQANVKLLEAKKLASQYQKEADKCSSGMDTCEEAREKSAESLGQRKLTALWEERARELGWKRPFLTLFSVYMSTRLGNITEVYNYNSQERGSNKKPTYISASW